MAEPIYMDTYGLGTLKEKIKIGLDRMASCEMCPRRCKVNRLENELGECRIGRKAMIMSHFPHQGEEAVLRERVLQHLDSRRPVPRQLSHQSKPDAQR